MDSNSTLNKLIMSIMRPLPATFKGLFLQGKLTVKGDHIHYSACIIFLIWYL